MFKIMTIPLVLIGALTLHASAFAQISMPAVPSSVPTSVPASGAGDSSMSKMGEAKSLVKTANEKATVHLNSASVTELQKVPGLNSELANAIVAARPFKSVADLKNVPGMKEAVYAKVKNYVSL